MPRRTNRASTRAAPAFVRGNYAIVLVSNATQSDVRGVPFDERWKSLEISHAALWGGKELSLYRRLSSSSVCCD